MAERLPDGERESLRQHLRANLDHSSVLEAVQRSLAGGNESARVAAVRFLADLELFRKDGGEGLCPRCAGEPYVVKNDVDPDRATEILAALEERGLIMHRGRLEEMVEERAQQRLVALKAEHGIPHP